MNREHYLAALAVEMAAGLSRPVRMARVPAGVDPRDDELRDAAAVLAWKRRVARNEQRRRQSCR